MDGYLSDIGCIAEHCLHRTHSKIGWVVWTILILNYDNIVLCIENEHFQGGACFGGGSRDGVVKYLFPKLSDIF
jgi:hypothetical protein